MKFKYTGENNHRDFELVAHKIMNPKDVLKKNMIIDVPDEYKRVIAACEASGVYEKVNATHVAKKEEKKKEDK